MKETHAFLSSSACLVGIATRSRATGLSIYTSQYNTTQSNPKLINMANGLAKGKTSGHITTPVGGAPKAHRKKTVSNTSTLWCSDSTCDG